MRSMLYVNPSMTHAIYNFSVTKLEACFRVKLTQFKYITDLPGEFQIDPKVVNTKRTPSALEVSILAGQ